ncbi:Alpha/Beta hydrolase protein [Dipodascopsis tothii]|uniref:Alpha/Beta hydrolase protein n=1 Tax=Dipodascopsis tothii TaxID=44089 RepID=UPI0034CD110C
MTSPPHRVRRPAATTLTYRARTDGSPADHTTLKVYPPAGDAPTADCLWVVFIHGGAWRDQAQTKDLGDSIVDSLPAHWGGASINYRLSPAVQHPDHVHDVLDALSLLSESQGFTAKTRVVLSGHSAGACLAFQAFYGLYMQQISALASGPAGAADLGMVFNSIVGVVGSEGIYDLVALADEYPAYVSFIEPAFGDRDHWAAPSPQHFEWEKLVTDYTKFMVVQSREDDLLSPAQSTAFVRRLTDAGWPVQFHLVSAGSHMDAIDHPTYLTLLRDFCTSVERAHV